MIFQQGSSCLAARSPARLTYLLVIAARSAGSRLHSRGRSRAARDEAITNPIVHSQSLAPTFGKLQLSSSSRCRIGDVDLVEMRRAVRSLCVCATITTSGPPRAQPP